MHVLGPTYGGRCRSNWKAANVPSERWMKITAFSPKTIRTSISSILKAFDDKSHFRDVKSTLLIIQPRAQYGGRGFKSDELRQTKDIHFWKADGI